MNYLWSPKNWRIRLAISLFIILNVSAILFTNTELVSLPVLSNILLPYAKITRLIQRWALFSPEPRRFVQLYYFEITHQDETVTKWQRPLPPNWSFFERQHSYNWQKFDTASNHMEDMALRQDILEWARRQFADETNPPTFIKLKRYYADIPYPSVSQSLQFDGKNLDLGEQLIFNYSVEEQKFL